MAYSNQTLLMAGGAIVAILLAIWWMKRRSSPLIPLKMMLMPDSANQAPRQFPPFA